MIREELKELKTGAADLRKFGLTVGGVLLYNEENRVVSSMSYHTRETIRQCVRAWAQSRDG